VSYEYEGIYQSYQRHQSMLVSRLFTKLHTIDIPYDTFHPSYFLLTPEVQRVTRQLVHLTPSYRHLFTTWLRERHWQETDIETSFDQYYTMHLRIVRFFHQLAAQSQMLLFVVS
jgi:hypothetical protein